MYIKKTFQQLWLYDDEGNKHNVAELLATLIKPKQTRKKKDITDAESAE